MLRPDTLSATVFGLIGLLASSASHALQLDWSMCRVPVFIPQPISEAQNDPSLTIDSGWLEGDAQTSLTLYGQPRIQQGQTQLAAELIRISDHATRLEAREQVTFSNRSLQLEADFARINTETSEAEFNGLEYRLFGGHQRGSSATLLQSDPEHYRLLEVSYTTCDPDDSSWSLNASSIEIDTAQGLGTARHAVFEVADIPIFYFPWLQFPIDDRRMSGLLTPSIAHTQREGYSLQIPVYLNLAPQTDMTLTMTEYSSAGLFFETENRYLTKHQQGTLSLNQIDDRITDETRWRRRWQHDINLNHNSQVTLLLDRVSDINFMQDYALSGNTQSEDYLKSFARVETYWQEIQATLLFETYQVINDDLALEDRPYERLPTLILKRNIDSDSFWQLDLGLDWSRFDKADSVTGNRLHLSPSLSFPFKNESLFFIPQLQLDHTTYQLTQVDGSEQQFDRNLTLLSIDSGLIFERKTGSKLDHTQTLEPRLYLLKVPYTRQQQLPVFDTSLLEANYDHLFVNNRFNGIDRIGDSEQLSLGLTSRLFDADYREILRLSIGQAYYRQSRKVSIDGQSDSQKHSPVLGELSYTPSDSVNLQLGTAYDQSSNSAVQYDASLQHSRNGRVFNFEYHFQDEALEQTGVSMVYPVAPYWQMFAARHYSVQQDHPILNLFGIAYESCCWGFRALIEERADAQLSSLDRGIYLQLTFKGLSDTGKGVNQILEHAILGYQPQF